MQLDIAALQRRDGRAMAELLELCRKCARIGSNKAGALSFSDDIAQDMVMFVLDRFLAVYDGERDVEPFLIEVGRRMGLSYYRRHSREVIVGEREDGADPLLALEDASLIADEQLQEDEEAKRAADAKAILVARVRARRSAVTSVKPKPRPRPPRAMTDACAERRHHVRHARSFRPAVRQIVALRKRMGLTQQQMSLALGLTPNAIRSLEYGIVDGQPEKLLVRAQELAAREAAMFDPGMGVHDLLARWCQRLRLSSDDVSGLASRIGVHRSTLFRWRTGRTQPLVSDLRSINAIVDAVAEHELGGRAVEAEGVAA